LKKFYKEIIILISFSDIAEFYFFNISDFKNYFKNCQLRWNYTYFKKASDLLKDILGTVSKKRSIRLLTFSDGIIKDSSECMKKLDIILNSTKLRHQMKSVSVRVSNNSNSVPDTKVLMKLSTFSYPISDMTQISIDPKKEKNIGKVVDKIYNQFKNDGMQFNLKLYSSIGMSDDFSKKFSQKEFSANKNLVLRINGHRNHYEYNDLLKMSSGKIVVENCGELKEHEFYDIMKKNTPFIAQKILERKVNQKNNSKETQEIIDYLKNHNYYTLFVKGCSSIFQNHIIIAQII
jgi:hypothetical protein